MSNDGIALISAAHPKTPWYRRLRYWFSPATISEHAIKDVEHTICSVFEPIDGKLIWTHDYCTECKQTWRVYLPKTVSEMICSARMKS